VRLLGSTGMLMPATLRGATFIPNSWDRRDRSPDAAVVALGVKASPLGDRSAPLGRCAANRNALTALALSPAATVGAAAADATG
jgi:hypothetical protein